MDDTNQGTITESTLESGHPHSPTDIPGITPATPRPSKRARGKAGAGAGTGTPGPIGHSTPHSQATPDPSTVEGTANPDPEIVVEAPEADAPSGGFDLFGFGSILDGLANRFTTTATSPSKAKAAQEDADFYVFIAESVVLSRTMSLAVMPSEQEHKLMVLGLADIIRSDGRVTRIAKGMKWVALPVGAGLWGLRIFTEYMANKAKKAPRANQQPPPGRGAEPVSPEFVPPAQVAEEDPMMQALAQMYAIPPTGANGLEPNYGVDTNIFPR